MDKARLARAADPDVFIPYLRDNAPPLPTGEHGHGPIQTVRKDTYRGHQIVVRTTYEIDVDGELLTDHLSVRNNGTVHTHDLPNYSFGSALELVRQMIDAFPESFRSGERPQTGDDGGQGHTHDVGA